ncbi:ribonuclease P protein component [Patescibacteria group bacterium]|nr:ribonuclease P protein component [Patescibacteria group bacterium]MBU1684524.1 ribonuclease P protein component [Patescibacteria group bacterium]MBU1987473.1 ribonuclease P protein component [Patescibacteria group bacterium]MBU2415673.1 ribonuclease P protein component [Patescibacteria group bacterium]
MFKRINRLTKNKEFDNVFANGRSSYDKIIGVKLVFNKLDKNRFGILVGMKISKKAVQRNKITRQVREIICSKLPFMKTGYDCVIITLPPILGKKYQIIDKSIEDHFRWLKLYKQQDTNQCQNV